MSAPDTPGRRVYLDHASTSPLRRVARDAMSAWMDDSVAGRHGDPSRAHAEALTARAAIEEARADVARLFDARPREVVFTSGATESIAAAIHGARGRVERGDGAILPADTVTHSVVVATEHAAVRLPSADHPHTVVGVDSRGRVDPDAVADAIETTTAVVHVQLGNHEVGTIHDLPAIAARCATSGALLHVDAAQGAGHVPISFRDSGIDLLSVSAHKMGGPTGVGALLVRRGLRLDPLLLGGDQERARRAGMEHTLGAVGFGAVAAELCDRLPEEIERATRQRNRLEASIGARADVAVLGDPVHRLPHILCVGLVGVEPQPVLIGLDNLGVAVHSGSSCSAEALRPSPVLEAMGVDAERSLRLSVGHDTTADDIERACGAVHRVLDDIARLGVRPRTAP